MCGRNVFLGFFLEIVVVHLDDKDDKTAASSHQVGEEERPDNLWFVEKCLKNKK